MSEEKEELVYFKLKNGVVGHYSIMSENGEDHYFLEPGKIVGVYKYDAPKLRCVPYAQEVTEDGMPVPDDPSKGPAQAVISKADMPGGHNVADDPERETPEEVPEPPEEEETIEDDPSMIEVDADDIVGLMDQEDDLNLEGKSRTYLVKVAAKLDYYDETDENPAQAKSEDLIDFIQENI